jgi:hypothetical protein
MLPLRSKQVHIGNKQAPSLVEANKRIVVANKHRVVANKHRVAANKHLVVTPMLATT